MHSIILSVRGFPTCLPVPRLLHEKLLVFWERCQRGPEPPPLEWGLNPAPGASWCGVWQQRGGSPLILVPRVLSRQYPGSIGALNGVDASGGHWWGRVAAVGSAVERSVTGWVRSYGTFKKGLNNYIIIFWIKWWFGTLRQIFSALKRKSKSVLKWSSIISLMLSLNR